MDEDFNIKEILKNEIQRLNSLKNTLEKASWMPIEKELELMDSMDTTIVTLLRTYAYLNTGNVKIKDDEIQTLLESIL